MRKIKKLNEFFDTDELKTTFEISTLTKKISPESMIRDFNTDIPIHQLLNLLIYKYPFINEIFNGNKYANLTENPKNHFNLSFRNENYIVTLIFIKKLSNIYDMCVLYFPRNIKQTQDNTIQSTIPLLDVYYDKIVVQEFKNQTINQIYNKMDKCYLQILKDLGFTGLLNLKKSSFDIDKN
jgi:hypothetical protein